MIRLLQWIVFGHVHKWETLHEKKLTDRDTGAVGTRFLCRCSTCGRVKKWDMI